MKKNLKVIQFLLFLLSNGALVSFFRNRMLRQSKDDQYNGILGVMSFVREDIECGNVVFYAAFVFKDSKEGHDYWAKLSEKWMVKSQQVNS